MNTLNIEWTQIDIVGVPVNAVEARSPGCNFVLSLLPQQERFGVGRSPKLGRLWFMLPLVKNVRGEMLQKLL